MTQPDEYEATRTVVAALQPFDDTVRERILRWVRDALNMSQATSALPGSGAAPARSRSLIAV